MDHIPLPLHPIRERFKVPLLSNQVYDNPGAFSQYPEQQGWTPRPRWLWKVLFQNPPVDFQAFLQRWLCFGVLDGVLDRQINIQDFAQQDSDGEYYFSTSHLVDFVDQSFRPAGVFRLLDALWMVASTASTEFGTFNKFVELPDDNEVQSLGDAIRYCQTPIELDPRVAIGITTVFEFLHGFAACHLERVARDRDFFNDQMLQSSFHDEPQTGKTPCIMPLRSTIWRLLRQDGWCPYQLSLMFSRFNMAGLLFMLHMQRPEPMKEHNVIRVRRLNDDEEGEKGQNHQERQDLCAIYGCGHRVLQQSTYTTKHCSECPGCHNVSPDIAELSGILMDGSFPLILAIGEQEDPERLCLVPWDEDVSYIAISHVWSDGLGNVQDNSLPLCQLRRVSKMVREMSGKASNVVLFWLDTICVPRFNEPISHEQKTIRTKAIAKMRKTYESSTATLVLDSWLLSVAGKGMSEAEILMRIFSCSWNSRLWTYQEGALPSTVYFQFEDMAFDIDDLVAELKRSMDSGMEYTLGQRLIRQHNALRGFRDYQGHISLQLFCIMGAMSYRTTTISTDEAICLSTLLDLDTAEISNTVPHERMKKLWKMLPEVPEAILRASGPKLDAPGFSWAPRSFLLTKDRVSPDTGQLATSEGLIFGHSYKLNEHGLVMRSCAMIIHCGHLRFPNTFHFKDQHGLWYHIESSFDGDIQTIRSHGPVMKSIEPFRFYGGEKVVFLLEYGSTKFPIGPVMERSKSGSLIIPGERRGGLQTAKRVGTAILTRVDSTQQVNNLRVLEEVYPFSYSKYSKNPPLAVNKSFGDQKILAITMAESVEVETDWCLV